MLLLAALGQIPPLSAATFVWDGGHPAQERLSDNQNWNPNGAPPNDGTADLVFTGAVRLNPIVDTAWSVNSITFNYLAGAFDLNGGFSLTIQGNAVAAAIANVDADTQTISAPLITGASQTWSANAGSLLISGAVANNYALTVAGVAHTTISGAISGSGSLTKTGAGTLILSGANTYSGGTTVSSGILKGSTSSLQGNISTASGSSLVFDQSSNGTFSGVLSGSGSLTKSGSGVVTLSGSNTFSGGAIISAGTLRLSGGSALSDTGAVVLADVSGATLDLAGSSETIGSLSGGGSNGGNVTLGSGGALSVGSSNTSTTFAGVISGSGSLTKTGSGSLTLTGSNSYSGGTTVSAGTLQGSTASLQGNISTASGSSLVFDQSSSGTFSGVLSGSGSLTKSGSGVVTLSGSNTFSGSTTVSGGGLALGANNALSASSALALASGTTLSLGGAYSARVASLGYADATLDFGTSGTANAFLFGSAGSASGTLTVLNWTSGSDTFAFASGASVADEFIENIYFSGVGSGVRGATGVSVSGYTGTWDTIVASSATFDTWNGAGANDNLGANANWSDGSAPVSGATTKIAFSGSTRVTPNLTSDLTLNSLKFDSGAGASFTLATNSGKTLTFAGSVPSLIQASGSAQTVAVPVALTKNTFVEIGGAGNLVLSGVVSGTGGFTVLGSGAGEVVLSGANTYSGNTAINAGTVVLQNSAALGDVSSGTSVASGATLRLENNVAVGSEALALSGTLRQASGNNSYAGAISGSGGLVVSGGQLTLSGASANTYSGDTIVSAGTLVLGKSAGVTAVSGNITVGSGSGSANLTLSSSNQIADSSRLTLSPGGTPVFNLANNHETLGSLSSSNPASSVSLGSATLSTGSDNSSSTFSGVISGSGGLSKLGSGTFTLSGSNSYSGTTTINAGTVVLQNSAALGATTGGTSVASGATLQLENNIAVGSEALALSGTLRQASGNNSYAGAISGSGGLVVSGGQLTLSGASANTYSGDTTVSAGTLVLGKSAGVTAVSGNITVGSGSGSANLTLSSSDQIADSSRVTLSSGGTPVFNLANNHETLGSLSSSNPASSVSLGSATLSTGSDNSSSTFAGIISGSGGLSKLGSGTFTLSGSNSYSGNTSVSSGTVALGASNRISDSSALALAGGTLALGGIYSERVGNLSYTDGSVVDLGAVGSANHLLFADDAASAGTLTVRNWTSGSDTFGVATNAVAQSFLDNIFFDGIGVGIGAEIGSLVSVSGYGSFYEIRPIATFSWVGGNSGGSSPVKGWSKGDNWSGGIAPGVGADKALVFGGSVDLANDMNGAYIVRSIRYDSSAGAFVTTSSTGDTLTLRGGGVYNDSTATQTLNVPVALGASQTWTAANGALSLTGATLLLGTNTLTVTGAANTSISAVVSGTGSAALVKNGAGTLALSGANTYSGTTTVSAGTLLASHASALGSTAAGTVVNSGGTLALSGGVAIGAESLSLSGSGAGGLGALRNVSGANSYAGAITLAGDATITSAAGSLSLTGTIAAGGNALAVDGAGDLVIASTISDATALAKSGSGTLAFTADQTFSGEITLGGGTLSLVDADLGVATLRVTAASVLDFSGSSTLTVGQLVLELGAGQTLSVTSWQEVSDFFLVSNFLGATRDTTGQAPMNQIVFATFSGDNTRWKSGAGEVTPVPEPATYGALALGGLAAWSALRRRRRV